MIVQLPLPPQLDENAALDRIVPEMDADGLTAASQGLLLTGRPGPRPATPAGVMELLDAYDVPLEGANAVIVGRSEIVGKPQALLLLERNATVTICHSRTRDLPAVTSAADVLVVAVGRPRMIGAEHVGEGAVVIDVGINRLEDGLAGDVDFAAVQPKARLITPVPGGVGPDDDRHAAGEHGGRRGAGRRRRRPPLARPLNSGGPASPRRAPRFAVRDGGRECDEYERKCRRSGAWPRC